LNRISEDLVQRWGSFVRRGYYGTTDGPIRPLDIDYDPLAEDLIAEVVARLDGLGDPVDGTLSDEEIQELINEIGEDKIVS